MTGKTLVTTRLKDVMSTLFQSPPTQPPSKPANPTLILITMVVCTIAILSFFLFYNFVMPQAPSRLERPSEALIDEVPIWSTVASFPLPFMQNPQTVAALIILFTAAVFAFYGLAAYLSLKFQLPRVCRWLIPAAAAFFSFLSIWALPTVNSDIYYHIMQAHIALFHNQNPYYVSTLEFPTDPLYIYVSQPYRPLVSVYPPAWTIFTIIPTLLSGSEPVANLLALRFTLWLFNLANIVLVAQILRRLNPQLQLTGVILYGWNPIIAVLGQSKPDTIMAFFLLAACLLLILNHASLAIVDLTLSALVKLITLPLVLAFILWQVIHRDWWGTLTSTLIAGFTTLMLYAPFLQEPGLVLRHLEEVNRGASAFPSGIRLILIAAFFMVLLYSTFKGNTIQNRLHGWTIIMLYFAIFFTTPANSWYLISLIALVSITPSLPMIWMAVPISGFSFFLNSWEITSSDTFRLPALLPSRASIYVILTGIVAISIILVMARRLRTATAKP